VTVSGVVTLNSEENCSQSLEVRSDDVSITICSSPMSVANKSTLPFGLIATTNNFTIEYRQSSSAAQHGVFVLLLHGILTVYFTVVMIWKRTRELR